MSAPVWQPRASRYLAARRPQSGRTPSASASSTAPGSGGSGLFSKLRQHKAKLRLARAARRQTVREQLGITSDGYCRRRTVTEETRRRYEKLHMEFAQYCRKNHFDSVTAADLDRTLDRFLDRMQLDGRPLHEARNAGYGVSWCRDVEMKDLPLTRKCLKGYSRLCPEVARDPVSWEATLLVADELAKSTEPVDWYISAAVLLNFDTYARPGALLKLKGSDLLPPAGPGGEWTVTFFPSSRQQKSKTNTQDDTVYVGKKLFTENGNIAWADRRWLIAVARALKAQVPNDGFVFRFTLREYETHVAAAAERAGLGHQKMVPHRFRHGGASVDAVCGVPQAEIKSRGMWGHDKSVARYMKHGRYLRELHKLTQEQSKAAHNLPHQLGPRLGYLLSTDPLDKKQRQSRKVLQKLRKKEGLKP